MSQPAATPNEDAVAGVVFEAPFRVMKVCAFFRDELCSDATWQVFGKYTPAPEGEQYGSPPVADVLELGVRVNVQGFVIPAQLGKRGEAALVLRAGAHYHFSWRSQGHGKQWKHALGTARVHRLCGPAVHGTIPCIRSYTRLVSGRHTVCCGAGQSLGHAALACKSKSFNTYRCDGLRCCAVCHLPIICLFFARTNCSLPIAQVGRPSHSAVLRQRRQHSRKVHTSQK